MYNPLSERFERAGYRLGRERSSLSVSGGRRQPEAGSRLGRVRARGSARGGLAEVVANDKQCIPVSIKAHLP